jgi:hypothetical protein
MHKQWSMLGYLRRWWQAAQVPLCISEFGTPETYDPATRVDDYNRFIKAGVDRHRVQQARMLRNTLEQAHKEGIPIPYGGWYPGTGNIGWGLSLTKERRNYDCDRAGLVDLARQADGTLGRVLCTNLVNEVMSLKAVGVTPRPRIAAHVDTVPAPPVEIPVAAAQAHDGCVPAADESLVNAA